MRSQLRYVVQDQAGNVRSGRAIAVFNYGTTTPISNTLYATATSVIALDASALVTDALGEIELWIDGLSAPVDIRVGGASGVTETVYFTPDPATLALASALPSSILTTQGDIIVGGVAGAPGRFGIGTAWQELVVNAGATALQWANGVLARVTTAGDLVQGTGPNAVARVAIGTAWQELTVNAGATAVQWASGVLARATAAGDIFQATGANAIARLAIGSPRFNLAVNAAGSAVEYVASIQSLIAAAGDLIMGSAANTAIKLAKGADGTFLGVVAGAVGWTSLPAGALPAADGSAATPTVNFTNATTAGLYRSGTGFGMAANGAAVALVTTAGLSIQSNQPVVPAAVSGTPAQHGLYSDNVPKMWVNYTSVTTTAILASFNVASLTDNGTGDTTITIDRDYATANNALVAGVDTGAFTGVFTARAAGSVRLVTLTSAAAAVDVVTSVISMGAQ